MIALNLFQAEKEAVVENARRRVNQITLPSDALLVGWIEGPERDRQLLRRLGVGGEMRFSPCSRPNGVFEQCIVTKSVLCRLEREYPSFWGGAFTAVDKNGDALPYDEQPFYGMHCTGVFRA